MSKEIQDFILPERTTEQPTRRLFKLYYTLKVLEFIFQPLQELLRERHIACARRIKLYGSAQKILRGIPQPSRDRAKCFRRLFHQKMRSQTKMSKLPKAIQEAMNEEYPEKGEEFMAHFKSFVKFEAFGFTPAEAHEYSLEMGPENFDKDWTPADSHAQNLHDTAQELGFVPRDYRLVESFAGWLRKLS